MNLFDKLFLTFFAFLFLGAALALIDRYDAPYVGVIGVLTALLSFIGLFITALLRVWL